MRRGHVYETGCNYLHEITACPFSYHQNLYKRPPISLLRRIVDLGVDVNKKDEDGYTPIDLCGYGVPSCVCECDCDFKTETDYWSRAVTEAIYLAYRGGNATRPIWIQELGQLLRRCNFREFPCKSGAAAAGSRSLRRRVGASTSNPCGVRS